MVEILVEAEIRPTEDVEKVKRAISTIIYLNSFNIEEITPGLRIIRVKCGLLNCLEPLKNTIRIQQIEPAVKAYLYKYRRGKELTMLFHKQAAYAGRISLVDTERESPLGPIKLEIRGTDEELTEIIHYLTSEK